VETSVFGGPAKDYTELSMDLWVNQSGLTFTLWPWVFCSFNL